MAGQPETTHQSTGLKIIGAGFGRTGTLSLKHALEELGYSPCYHMSELFDKPGVDAQWDAIVSGEPADWHTIFSVSHLNPDLARTTHGHMVHTLIWQGTFDNRFEDKEYAIAVFLRHIQEVKEYVPAEKLLVYEVKEGWEPLCAFLGVAVPAGKPFPHDNDRANFLGDAIRQQQPQ